MPRSSRSRHRQHDVLSGHPTFEQGQSIVRVARALGENIYEVEDERGCKALYQLPKRLRHVAFIKRGSFVFVREDSSGRTGRVKGDIEIVVLDQFLSALRKNDYWPRAFGKDDGEDEGPQKVEEGVRLGIERQSEDEEDWEVGGGNPNRQKWAHVSSEEDSDS